MPGGQVSEAGRLPSPHRVRTRNDLPRPAPRPGIVDACAALAGFGFGAVLAAVILGESRGSLAAPGGLSSAAGRPAGRLCRDVPHADHGGARGTAAVAGALGRPGSARPLAPAGCPLGDRPHHGPCRPDRARLRAGSQHRGVARAVGAADVLPGHAGGGGRVRLADRGRSGVLPEEALQAESASIQGVSGASYTSAGFAQSLQAALHQLGMR
jgi:hypothetical protein